jgi:hypothetical protein
MFIAAIGLGELLWSLLVIYLMVTYFVMLFSVVRDIFRSDDMGGFGKAAWCFALFFFPFVSLLVYLIARGQGMAKRSAADAAKAQADVDDYIRSVASSGGGAATELAKAKELVDSGAITAEEFTALKRRLLA